MAKFLTQLPPDLENAEALLKRREKAKKRKENWRSLYRDCYKYAMPMRDTFDWDDTPGQFKNNVLYDSTLQDVTYEAANTMVALLMPAWQRWARLVPGTMIANARGVDIKQVTQQLQEITEILFDFLNQSNFATVSNEIALDLLVGTAALRFDESVDDDNPFDFSATPLATLELEEGPSGTIETVFMLRKPLARNLTRMYPGMEQFDLPFSVQECIEKEPDKPIEIVQATVYHPATKKYYGIVLSTKDKLILWRYEYGDSSPDIVGRAFRVAGELYGRGRITLALSDARSLDKMQEFVLRHSALQIAPPSTGVSDGVLNPYTAVLMPNTILPVGSNDARNPSLRPLEIGGNFAIGDHIMDGLRERIRRTMLGPEPSEGPVKSATETSINDRNRLWALGGEFGRIQAEVLTKVVNRGVQILQSRGLAPQFKINGRTVAVSFESPFARSQDAEDLLAFDNTVMRMQAFEGMAPVALDVDLLSEWLPRKSGLDMRVVNDKQRRAEIKQEAADAAAQAAKLAQEQGLPLG